MDCQCHVVVEVEQQELALAPRPHDRLAQDRPSNAGGFMASYSASAIDLYRLNAPPDDLTIKIKPNGFDFWELRHAVRLLIRSWIVGVIDIFERRTGPQV